MLSKVVPVRTPRLARPVSCCHSDSVCRSYITRLLAYSIPDVPKLSTRLGGAPVERQAGVAQRAVSDRDRNPGDRVVHDLVPGQHLHRVRPGLPRNRQCQHQLGRREPVDLAGTLETGMVDRRDPVRRRTTGHQLAGVDQRPGQPRVTRVVQR